jgi:hypothetical protein
MTRGPAKHSLQSQLDRLITGLDSLPAFEDGSDVTPLSVPGLYKKSVLRCRNFLHDKLGRVECMLLASSPHLCPGLVFSYMYPRVFLGAWILWTIATVCEARSFERLSSFFVSPLIWFDCLDVISTPSFHSDPWIHIRKRAPQK